MKEQHSEIIGKLALEMGKMKTDEERFEFMVVLHQWLTQKAIHEQNRHITFTAEVVSNDEEVTQKQTA